ncbi:MAG: T9SS type A sorting domain-containing protein, partial [Flavobacteriales bacterium]|nr:T9SS type A sorting domain-containing protein [Flavobacteriales bacterium]
EDYPVAVIETDVAGGTTIKASFKVGAKVLATISSSSNELCVGSCDGAATAKEISGTTPYTYLWDDGQNQTTITATGLCTGTYTVQIIDALSDTAAASVTIGSPTPLVGVIVTTDDNGTSNGTASVSITGGTPPYFYVWSTLPPQTTSTAVNLTSGPYGVTVTDFNGCTYIDSGIVNGVACNVVSAFNSSAPVCEGQAVSFADLSANATSYDWLKDGVSFASSANPTLVFNVPGTFLISFIAINGGCRDTAIASISIGANPTIVSTAATAESACGTSDGTIVISASGGTPPLQYSINGGISFLMANGFSSLAAGNYAIAISDAVGCIVFGSTLTIFSAGGPTTSAGIDAATCEGNDYTLAGTMGGAASSVTWTSSGSGVFDDSTSTTASYTPSSADVTAGFVTLTITTDDPGGLCFAASDSMQLTINSNPAKPTLTVAGNALSCDQSGFNYQWVFNNDTIVGATNQIHVAAQDGFYQVAVIDTNGCSAISASYGYVGIQATEGIFGIDIYPNPSSGLFFFDVKGVGNDELVIRIENILGQSVYEQVMDKKGDQVGTSLDVSFLPTGIYYVEVIAGNTTTVRKIVLQ